MRSWRERRDYYGRNMKDWGPARVGHHMGWGQKGAWFVNTPWWFKIFVVWAWNHVACTLFRHDHLVQGKPGGPVTCVSCCRRVTRYAPEDVIREF